MIVTAGAIDCHVHFICPQLAHEAISSGELLFFLECVGRYGEMLSNLVDHRKYCYILNSRDTKSGSPILNLP